MKTVKRDVNKVLWEERKKNDLILPRSGTLHREGGIWPGF